MLNRKVNIMKKAEKRHKQRLQEYKEKKIGFATEEEEIFIRLFYTQQELEDIFAGYDLGVKRLHLQNLYMERMRQLFNKRHKLCRSLLIEALLFIDQI